MMEGIFMNSHVLYEKLEISPVIAAIKTQEQLEKALLTDVEVIFVLSARLTNLTELSEKIKKAGKTGFIHVDLVKGFSVDESIIEYIARFTAFDGIISTKASLISPAKKWHLLVIERFFLLDSLALENVKKQLFSTQADVIELLPNISPKVISEIVNLTQKPVIVGGLIRDKEDIMSALGAGSLAISTTNLQIWQA